jgi:ABC-2 type transport system ATP-binding protein
LARNGTTVRDREVSIVISARELKKSYYVPIRQPGFVGSVKQLFSSASREVKAVAGVNFDIPTGQFIGYIGPNGAGKSTTVKMMCGILHPTSGEILVNGLSPQKERQKLAWQIGVVFGQRTQLWWDLPTIDSFEILAAMYEVKRDDYLSSMKSLSDLLGLDEFLNTPVRRLSLGQRMRADLAAVLLHHPEVLFLDEPTIGLDVMAKSRIREFLARLNREQGVTILLTTHDLRDVEELCERVMVIDHGSIMYDGTILELGRTAGLPTHLSVRYASLPAGIAAGQFMTGTGLSLSKPSDAYWRVSGVDYPTETITVAFDRTYSPVLVVLEAMKTLGDVRDITITEPLIEEMIRQLLEK